MAAASAGELLEAAAEPARAGPASGSRSQGRAERDVVAASAQADLLIVARDGDRARLGPKSLGKATRFVVDHAACPVLLVWPGSAPGVATIPPPPHHPSRRTAEPAKPGHDTRLFASGELPAPPACAPPARPPPPPRAVNFELTLGGST